MRTHSSKSGPFLERPFYTKTDVERICDDELKKYGHFPSTPEPVRIDRFVEKRFGLSVKYETLPVGVLGFTCFGRSGVVSIHISGVLAEDDTRSAERRINSTLAHEAGHGFLHSHLFAFAEGRLSLFDGDPDVTSMKILCREPEAKAGSRPYDGRWWEVQANMVIGPLLMPRSLVKKAIQPFVQKQGLLGIDDVDARMREDAISRLAEVFNVNPVVARIRLDDIFPKAGPQLML